MKNMKKLLTITMMFLLFVLVTPTTANAAGNPKLNKTSATIYKYQTTQLKLKGTKKKVTWSTSNKKVATVSSKGKVTAKNIGKATITAKIKNGKKVKSYKCRITVKKPYISAKAVTVRIGQPTVIKLVGADIKSVKSNDTGIATIDKSGRIIGHRVGTTTVTVIGKRGGNYKCKVTVNEAVKQYDGFDVWGNGYTQDPLKNWGEKVFECEFPVKLYTVTTYNGQVGYFFDWNITDDTVRESCRMELAEKYPEYVVGYGGVGMGMYNGIIVGWQGRGKN